MLTGAKIFQRFLCYSQALPCNDFNIKTLHHLILPGFFAMKDFQDLLPDCNFPD
jgi:hypothetical protein